VALEDKPHPKPTSKLNEQQEAHLVAVTCSTPPAGHARWTLELLQERLIQDGIVSGIAPETVRLLLKKTNSNLGL
jgi:transposase